MLAAIALVALLQSADAEPEPRTLYEQALGCAASASVARDAVNGEARELDTEILTWGLTMAEFGRRIGRTREQVDHQDFDRAKPFFAQMKAAKPAVFEAHRAYCRAFLP